MKKFEKNIVNLYGEIGQTWLNSLPKLVDELSKQWKLHHVQSVKNMSWNFVALAIKENLPVVLKISCDKKLIQDEYRTLKHFNGNGAIKVLDISMEYHALLLEQAVPGYLLKERHPDTIEDTIHIYANVVKKLSICESTDTQHISAREWCKTIDKINDPRIDSHLIKKAKKIKSELLNTIEQEYLCHGDLHLENIIQQGSNWVAIDPKGIIGEMAFEAAAFDLLSKNEMDDASTIPAKILDRVTIISRTLDIRFDRLLAWIFLRIIISAQWFIEDNGDPSQMLVLASYVHPLLNETPHNNHKL